MERTVRNGSIKKTSQKNKPAKTIQGRYGLSSLARGTEPACLPPDTWTAQNGLFLTRKKRQRNTSTKCTETMKTKARRHEKTSIHPIRACSFPDGPSFRAMVTRLPFAVQTSPGQFLRVILRRDERDGSIRGIDREVCRQGVSGSVSLGPFFK